MSYSPLTLSRRHVLGDIYARCERVAQIPVYLNEAVGEKIGFADESQGEYADAFTFHVSEEICKKLAGGQFLCSFNYEFADKPAGRSKEKRRIRLTSLILTMRKGYEKPKPKGERVSSSEPEVAEVST